MLSRALFVRSQHSRVPGGLTGGLILAFAVSLFVLAFGGVSEACPTTKEASSIVADTTHKTPSMQKKEGASQPVLEMASPTVKGEATGHGCCGNPLSGSNCHSFSCSTCFFALPTMAVSYSPGIIASVRGVPEDIGLTSAQPQADFRPPRSIA